MKKEKENIIKFEVNSRLDRDGLVTILTNNGYKVWVERKEWGWSEIYYVYVEIK